MGYKCAGMRYIKVHVLHFYVSMPLRIYGTGVPMLDRHLLVNTESVNTGSNPEAHVHIYKIRPLW